MTQRVTGTAPLSYQGVQAVTPPNLIRMPRQPTPTDINFPLGTLWLYNKPNDTTTNILFVLTRLAGPQRTAVATWNTIYPASEANLTFVTSTGDVHPDVNNEVFFNNGTNTFSQQIGPNTLTFNLVDNPNIAGNVTIGGNLHMPATTLDGLHGIMLFNNVQMIAAPGSNNIFLGPECGNLTFNPLQATNNTFVGFGAGSGITTGAACTFLGTGAGVANQDGQNNTFLGSGTGGALTTGDHNTAVGTNAMQVIPNGGHNVCFGEDAGSNLTGGENFNVYLAHDGLAGESRSLRLGQIGFIDNCWLAGVHGTVVDDLASAQLVAVDNTDKTSGFAPTANGQVIIGAGTGGIQWNTLTAGAGIIITNAANAITIAAGGGPAGGITTIHTMAGDANENAPDTSVTLVGANVIQTAGDGVHTATVSVTTAPVGVAVIMGRSDTHAPTWGTLVSNDASVGITQPTPTTINLTAAGGGGGTNTFHTDAGDAIGAGGAITIHGGTNIGTTGAGATVTINLDNAILLPATTNANTGNIAIGATSLTADRFLHGFGTNNTFVGHASGNFTLTGTRSVAVGTNVLTALTSGSSNVGAGAGALASVSSAPGNVAIGDNALTLHTTGTGLNVAIGFHSGNSLTTGNSNVLVGANSGTLLNTGNNNLALGNNAGSLTTGGSSGNVYLGSTGFAGAENNVMRLGQQGTITTSYMAGVYNTAQPSAGTSYRVPFVEVDGGMFTTATQPTDGQILIGNSTANTGPTWNTIAVDNGLTITNGHGTITIHGPGGGGGNWPGGVTQWNVVNTLGPTPIVANQGYISTYTAGMAQFTLPGAGTPVGSVFAIGLYDFSLGNLSLIINQANAQLITALVPGINYIGAIKRTTQGPIGSLTMKIAGNFAYFVCVRTNEWLLTWSAATASTGMVFG